MIDQKRHRPVDPVAPHIKRYRQAGGKIGSHRIQCCAHSVGGHGNPLWSGLGRLNGRLAD
ncbi:hypothetical protein [Pseudonocardia sp. TMWB2A]|uniref:hypothetical protein n=1 Tax=Pseudonocardia sp. TMWB2A TaxID=687430 RepID=UPI00307F3B0D